MDSLFTNIPLVETVNICCDFFFENGDRINDFNRCSFQKLLRSYSLPNAFLCFHEQIWINDYPEVFKPVYYRKYIGDMIACFMC